MVAKQFGLKIHHESDHIWAEVDELPGCFASGADIDELREALTEAIGVYLSDYPGQCKVVSLEFTARAAVQHVPAQVHLVPA